MYAKIAMTALRGGTRVLMPAMSRRALVLAAGKYAGVPLLLDTLVTQVSKDKLSEETQLFAVVAGTALLSYGPARAASAVRAALMQPRAAAAYMRAAPIALAMGARLNLKAAAAMMSKVSISVASGAVSGSRVLRITLPKYGTLEFAAVSGKISMKGSTAAITGLALAGGFLSSVPSLSFDDVVQGAFQIATALVAEAKELEAEEIEEMMFESDPLSLISRLAVIGEAAAREHPLTSRQEIASMAIKALSTVVSVKDGMFFDVFMDQEGDAVLVIDGTTFSLALPSFGSDLEVLEPVEAGQRSNLPVPGNLAALAGHIEDMFSHLAKLGKIPFVRADGGWLYGPPHDFVLGEEGMVASLAISEDGVVHIHLFEGGWFSSSKDAYSGAATRNWIERIYDGAESGVTGGVNLVSDAAKATAESVASLFESIGWKDAKDPVAVEVEVVKRDSRLAAEKGEIVFFMFNELEEIL